MILLKFTAIVAATAAAVLNTTSIFNTTLVANTTLYSRNINTLMPNATILVPGMTLLPSILQNTTTNPTPTGMDIYWFLAPLAMLTTLQRSTSDEFASWTMAPVRASPFICLSNIITSIIWIVYDLTLRLSLHNAFKFSIAKSAVSGSDSRRELLGAQNIILVFGFVLTLIQTVISASAVKGKIWETMWVVLFLLAYLWHVVVDVVAYFATASAQHIEQTPALSNTNPRIQKIFNIVDIIGCAAYAAQIRACVDISGNLTKVLAAKYGQETVDVVVIGMITLVVVLSLVSPKKGAYKILHGLWSLCNWDTNHQFTIIVCAFVIYLMLGLPLPAHLQSSYDIRLIATHDSSALWPLILIPLGTLSIVVHMVFTVSILHTVTRKMFRVEAPGEFEEHVEDALAWRLNPVAKSIRKWREILSISFPLCKFLYGFLYYNIVYASLGTKVLA